MVYINGDITNNSTPKCSAKYDLLNAAANSLGGTLACVNDDTEKEFLNSKFNGYYIGCRYNKATGEYEWEDGST